jgi:pyruvate dehydrogenase E2 component (dihydrolipoamide acetyltransferase)
MTASHDRGASPSFIDVAGRRIRHRIVGEGDDAIVMVHGLCSSLDTWSRNQEALAAGGRRVAALDLPGHGESSLDVGSGSLDELATVVFGYMDAVGIRRAHLVGNSMGAAVCLAMTDHAPERVRSLVLVGPAGIGQKIDSNVIRGLVGGRSREELEPLLGVLYADRSALTDDLVEQLVAYKQRPGVVEALVTIASSRYSGTPSGRQLRDVAGDVPTLMIWGADDRMIPPPAPEAIVREGVSLRVLPRCGHMAHVEAADAVNRLIEEFLPR